MTRQERQSIERRVPRIGLLMLDRQSYAVGMAGDALLEYAEQRFVGQNGATLIAEHAEGCTIDRLIYEGDVLVRDAMVVAARELTASGAEAIVGDCGFMLRHQAAISEAVHVPVALSGLLLIPLLQATLGRAQKLAVITASATSLTDELLLLSGEVDLDRVVVGDMAGQPAFDAAIMQCIAEVDDEAIEGETVRVADQLVNGRDDIGAVLLECTALPQFAAAVQQRVNLPVYDVSSLVDFITGGLQRSAGTAPVAGLRQDREMT
jgi:aspartate/glutamate racemase